MDLLEWTLGGLHSSSCFRGDIVHAPLLLIVAFLLLLTASFTENYLLQTLVFSRYHMAIHILDDPAFYVFPRQSVTMDKRLRNTNSPLWSNRSPSFLLTMNFFLLHLIPASSLSPPFTVLLLQTLVISPVTI